MRPIDVTPRVSTALRREFYLAYLNSAEWRAVRNRKLHAVGYRCEPCGAKRNLQVHHRTYERLGCELDADLTVLCADCHERTHIRETESSEQVGIYLKLAREALHEQPFATISDLADRTKELCAQRKITYDRHQVDRALGLITGTRIARGVVVKLPAADGRPEWLRPLSEPEVHELFKRIEEGLGVDLVTRLRGIPGELTPQQAAAHEQDVRDQAKLILAGEYRAARRRRPVYEQIDAIFEGRL